MDVLDHNMPEKELTNAYAFEALGLDDHPDEAALEVQAGDCVLFHSRLLHKTGGNVTDGHRRVLTVHMASAKCKATSENTPEYGFRLVRGRNYEGCIRAPEKLAVEYGKRA